MKMGYNFFKDLKLVEDSVIKKGFVSEVVFSDSEKDLARKVVAFVEAHPFTTSESTSYICKNWRLNSVEITKRWNLEFEKQKSNNTFRSQIVTISGYFRKMLLTSLETDNLYQIFTQRNEKDMRDLSLIIDAIWQRDTDYFEPTFDSLFSQEIVSFCKNVTVEDDDFTIGDCEFEIRVLKKLMNSATESVLNNTDVSKVAFIRKLLNEPLTCSTKKEVNLNKVKVLRMFKVLNEISFNELENTEVVRDSEKGLEVIEKVVEKVVVKEVEKEPPYSLLTYEKLFQMIEDYASTGVDSSRTYEDKRKLWFEVSNILTEEGFKKFLHRFNPADMQKLLSAFEKYGVAKQSKQ